MNSRSPLASFLFRLNLESGVPVYRQIMDQVRAGMASGSLRAGDQLPTVRQLAVDLAINPNTVARAYRELELGGLLDTHQGTGSFISAQKIRRADAERERQLTQIVGDCVARAGAMGFTVEDVVEFLRKSASESNRRR
ncbi:MAG TPA: GntR family transcriptional regulator [Acidobacteriaceae bacterium]|nr:GntR family transcriptional regulator [Acidobacteriaceae bacterium]